MAESIAEATVEIPVAVPTTAVLDAATAAAEVAATNAETDDDYKWLTDRLDALCAENRTLRETLTEQTGMIRELLRINQEQAAETNRMLTRQNETLTTQLTALAATAQQSAVESLRLTPSNLSAAEPEVIAEQEPEVIAAELEPASVAVVPVAPAEKKRRRI